MRRFLITAPAAILLTAGLATAPALAKKETCTAEGTQLRGQAATADAAAAKQALRYIATGEKLCEAGNERAAGKKFAAAAKALNVATASLDTGSGAAAK